MRGKHGDLFKDAHLYSGHWRAGLRVWLASPDILAGLTVLSASSGFSVSVWNTREEALRRGRRWKSGRKGQQVALSWIRTVGVTSSESSVGDSGLGPRRNTCPPNLMLLWLTAFSLPLTILAVVEA